jgi:hypothetical protein
MGSWNLVLPRSVFPDARWKDIRAINRKGEDCREQISETFQTMRRPMKES